jgi:hypothetical protein
LNRRRRPFQGRALPLSYLASVQTSLSANFKVQFCARIPPSPDEVGESTKHCAEKQPQTV